jgi:aminopeptidase YwaD
MEHIERLVNDIGARPVGSSANHAAADYLARCMSQLRLDVELQRFVAPAWSHLRTELYLGDMALDARANAFSPACDLRAPLVAACTLAQLERTAVAGKIVVLYGELTKDEIWSRHNPIYFPDHHRRLIEHLERARPAAILMISPRRGDLTSLYEDPTFDMPSAVVEPESGLHLLEAAAWDVHREASLEIIAACEPGYGHHVIGRRAGVGAGRIVVCAHFDTKFGTPGAWDNASGAAVLLGTAAALCCRPLQVGVEFVAFNNEEYYAVSPQHAQVYDDYLRAAGAMEDVIAAINIDGVGHKLSTTTVTLLAGSDALSALLDEVIAPMPSIQRVDPWFASNHHLYFARGVPSFALSATGTNGIMHQHADTPDWLSLVKLAEAETLVSELIRRLEERSPAWTRPG